MKKLNYHDQIHQVIGEIIKLIQYIEWNLCLELEIDGFADLTLGQIKTQVLNEEILDEDLATELIFILEKRNDLIHKYFKRLDFEKHFENTSFLDNQYRYLLNLKERVQSFNHSLVEK